MEKCLLCDKYFRGKFELKEHNAIEHQGEPLLILWYCVKQYQSINSFNGYILKCHQLGTETAKICSKCFKTFYSQTYRMDHQRYTHDVPKLICYNCNSRFDFNRNFNRHQKACSKRDINGKKLKCFTCCKRFKRTKYLLDHINGQHKPPKYEYQFCGKKFPYRSSWSLHKKQSHS